MVALTLSLSLQPSIPTWLDLIGLSQYEQDLIDAGYDDIDFISDITSEELEDIGITKKGMWVGVVMRVGVVMSCAAVGHLKRFMRGIAELVEVTKSSPPTPSLIPVVAQAQHFTNLEAAVSERHPPVEPHPPVESLPPVEDTSKTPEPTVNATPTSNSKPHPDSASSNFARMKSLLAQQMGISGEGEVDGSDHSPSVSPVVEHRNPKTAPPPPKRGGTQTSLAPNRHSPSSSTSSLSSNQSERVPGSHDHPLAKAVPIASSPSHSRRELACDSMCGQHVTYVDMCAGGEEMSRGQDEVDGALSPGKKSYSVEDITSALDDMIEGNDMLRENEHANHKAMKEKERTHPSGTHPSVSAEDELDALSQALRGFPPKAASNQKSNDDDDDDIEG